SASCVVATKPYAIARNARQQIPLHVNLADVVGVVAMNGQTGARLQVPEPNGVVPGGADQCVSVHRQRTDLRERRIHSISVRECKNRTSVAAGATIDARTPFS